MPDTEYKNSEHPNDRTPLPAVAPSDPSRADWRRRSPPYVCCVGGAAGDSAGSELPPLLRPTSVAGHSARSECSFECRLRAGRSVRNRKARCTRPRRVSRRHRSGPVLSRAWFGLYGARSACYHLHPDDVTLVWDRLPMTLVFTGVLAVAIAGAAALSPLRAGAR